MADLLLLGGVVGRLSVFQSHKGRQNEDKASDLRGNAQRRCTACRIAQPNRRADWARNRLPNRAAQTARSPKQGQEGGTKKKDTSLRWLPGNNAWSQNGHMDN